MWEVDACWLQRRSGLPNAPCAPLQAIASNVDTKKQFLVRASYLEIYNEEIRDLLSKDHTARLELKENVDHEVYVKDLTAIVVRNSVEMDTVLQAGKRNRVTGETKMNATSSRSHAVFTITLETSEPGADGKDHIRVGKLNLVDLAGCAWGRSGVGVVPLLLLSPTKHTHPPPPPPQL